MKNRKFFHLEISGTFFPIFLKFRSLAVLKEISATELLKKLITEFLERDEHEKKIFSRPTDAGQEK